jgi:carboxymethylenebutenolidase
VTNRVLGYERRRLFSDENERARLSGFMSSLTRDRIISDTGAYLDYLLTRPEVVGTTAGTTGYCMGARPVCAT